MAIASLTTGLTRASGLARRASSSSGRVPITARPIGHDPAVVELDRAIRRVRHEPQVVGRGDEGRPGGKALAEDLEQGFVAVPVLPEGRLVEHEHGGFAHEGAGE